MTQKLNAMDLLIIIETLRASLLISNPHQSYKKEVVISILEKLFQVMQDIDVDIVKK
jgi:hypothetical protein